MFPNAAQLETVEITSPKKVFQLLGCDRSAEQATVFHFECEEENPTVSAVNTKYKYKRTVNMNRATYRSMSVCSHNNYLCNKYYFNFQRP